MRYRMYRQNRCFVKPRETPVLRASANLVTLIVVMSMDRQKNKVWDSIKVGYLTGLGIGLGLLTSGLFAAAAAMNIFSSGAVISAAGINQNFAIAAPEGAVMAFYLTSCPEGWAAADGTNGTPNLRGLFIRGRDDAGTGPAGNDPGGSRTIGNLQLDAFQGHRMNRNPANVTEFAVYSGGPIRLDTGFNMNQLLTEHTTTGDPVTDSSNGTPRIANETRPKNVALTYCMRKN